ncbi:MAG: hypothetical protein R2827_05040 [Bdellovibrionales bacterium]
MYEPRAVLEANDMEIVKSEIIKYGAQRIVDQELVNNPEKRKSCSTLKGC